MPRLITAAVAAACMAIVFAALAVPAEAQFSADEQKCRAAIGKAGSKYASAIGKTLAKCHKGRNSEKNFGAGVDCNAISPSSDPKGKIGKAQDKLLATMDDGEKSKCSGFDPISVGFDTCPSPCEVVTVNTMDDAAVCASCVIGSLMTTALDTVAGTPTPPLDKTDGKCHAAILKGHEGVVKAVLKDRFKCQKAFEKNGVHSNDFCAGPDLFGKMQSTIDKNATKIRSTCETANLTNVDSCDATVIGLGDCVTDDASATTADPIFDALNPDFPPFTWTEIYNLFTGGDVSTNCAGSFCHIGQAAGGMAMTGVSGDTYDVIVGTNSTQSSLLRVEAGDASRSYLLHKLNGSQGDPPANGTGTQMPQGKAVYDATTRARIAAWIDAGAPEN